MAEATEQDIKDLVSGLSNVSSDTIYSYLDTAKAKIIGNGVSVTNSRFAELQKYLTLHLMKTGNVIAGNVVSENVADVGVTYESGQGSLKTLYATNWEREYHKCLNQIQGLDNKFL